jgi:hypothetical protein
MYSQQTNSKPKTCTNKNERGEQCGVLITWVPNPNKPGVNPKTNRPWQIPWEVNTNQQHRCPYFSSNANAQTNQYYDQRQGQGQMIGSNLAKPTFTPNDKTVESIEQHLRELVTGQDRMIQLLEILAKEPVRNSIGSASDISEHYQAQNNTGYAQDD